MTIKNFNDNGKERKKTFMEQIEHDYKLNEMLKDDPKVIARDYLENEQKKSIPIDEHEIHKSATEMMNMVIDDNQVEDYLQFEKNRGGKAGLPFYFPKIDDGTGSSWTFEVGAAMPGAPKLRAYPDDFDASNSGDVLEAMDERSTDDASGIVSQSAPDPRLMVQSPVRASADVAGSKTGIDTTNEKATEKKKKENSLLKMLGFPGVMIIAVVLPLLAVMMIGGGDKEEIQGTNSQVSGSVTTYKEGQDDKTSVESYTKKVSSFMELPMAIVGFMAAIVGAIVAMSSSVLTSLWSAVKDFSPSSAMNSIVNWFKKALPSASNLAIAGLAGAAVGGGVLAVSALASKSSQGASEDEMADEWDNQGLPGDSLGKDAVTSEGSDPAFGNSLQSAMNDEPFPGNVTDTQNEAAEAQGQKLAEGETGSSYMINDAVDPEYQEVSDSEDMDKEQDKVVRLVLPSLPDLGNLSIITPSFGLSLPPLQLDLGVFETILSALLKPIELFLNMVIGLFKALLGSKSSSNQTTNDEGEATEEEGETAEDVQLESQRTLKLSAFLDSESAEKLALRTAGRLSKYWRIGLCEREYTNDCPIGWNFVETTATESQGADQYCEPDPDSETSYTGSCGPARIKNFSAQEKENFAVKCYVEWPCKTAPDRGLPDSGAGTAANFPGCPQGWSTPGGLVCVAPVEYVGPCPPIVDLAEVSDWSSWSNLCEAQFLPKGELYAPSSALLVQGGGFGQTGALDLKVEDESDKVNRVGGPLYHGIIVRYADLMGEKGRELDDDDEDDDEQY